MNTVILSIVGVGSLVLMMISLRAVIAVAATAVAVYLYMHPPRAPDASPSPKAAAPKPSDPRYGVQVPVTSAMRTTVEERESPLYENHLDARLFDARMETGKEADWKRFYTDARTAAQRAAAKDLEREGRKDPALVPLEGPPGCQRDLTRW